MKKLSWLTCVTALCVLNAAQAQNTFRVTVVKGEGEPKLTPEQAAKIRQAGIAFPDRLPILVVPANGKIQGKADPSNTFQVVVENVGDSAASITMFHSYWEGCLDLRLSGAAEAAFFFSQAGGYVENTPETRTWPPHGALSFPVSLLAPDAKGALKWCSFEISKTTKAVWPSPNGVEIASLRVTFRYRSDGAQVFVTSKPIPVILMSQ
jgi:hypothetical protein